MTSFNPSLRAQQRSADIEAAKQAVDERRNNLQVVCVCGASPAEHNARWHWNGFHWSHNHGKAVGPVQAERKRV